MAPTLHQIHVVWRSTRGVVRPPYYYTVADRHNNVVLAIGIAEPHVKIIRLKIKKDFLEWACDILPSRHAMHMLYGRSSLACTLVVFCCSRAPLYMDVVW